MWFDNWSDIGRVAVVGAAAYAALVVILRLTGKRTLAKLNAFDLVVTVAFGSTLATVFLSSDVSWAEGAVAFAVLAILQYVVAVVTTRVPGSRAYVTATPTLVLCHGRIDENAMRRLRLTPAEIHQAVRQTGTGDIGQVAAVVLETDGTVSVISGPQAGDWSALSDVQGAHVGPRADGRSSGEPGDR